MYSLDIRKYRQDKFLNRRRGVLGGDGIILSDFPQVG